ncbi:DNA alkylation repair protein [Jonesia quinghaiensis]|uniref:DNA alkylation repair protein n=1 Tax=Jonesia quinghaiensis TaxID=262806 RepID=UPI0003FF878E|nr:DNA alkylation repair protein [Jonesia quinghaiensis]
MPFADELLGREAAATLVDVLATVAPERDLAAVRAAADALDGLALRERSDLLRDALLTTFPDSYRDLATVARAAHAHTDAFAGWLIWPVTSAVAVRAVDDGSPQVFDDAMDVLAVLTGRLTSEFAIRTLLLRDWERAMGIVQGWVSSQDHHVRRLASEGTRPFLPWGVRVPQLMVQPEATLPVLDALYRDESDYVRTSVANHLNDLSRNNPDLVVSTVRRWLADPAPTTDAVVRRALRTLVKRGDPAALDVLGFSTSATIEISGPVVGAAHVAIGESLPFAGHVKNIGTEPANVLVDYVVYHHKANGTQTSKTFKLTSRTLAPGEVLQLSRSHSLKLITTRRYHPGPHAIALQVNGVATEPVPFMLLPAGETTL